MTSAHESVRDPERVALKEWAVLVDAMARGDLIAMIRKGGIREKRAGFDVRHDRFLLYPTFFHEKLHELAERFHPTLESAHATRPPEGMIELRYVADVAAVWQVTELERLRAVGAEHGLTWGAVESRVQVPRRSARARGRGAHREARCTGHTPGDPSLYRMRLVGEARRGCGCRGGGAGDRR